MIDLTGSISMAEDMYGAGPSGFGSSSSRTRMLDFYVQHYDRTFKLRVSWALGQAVEVTI